MLAETATVGDEPPKSLQNSQPESEISNSMKVFGITIEDADVETVRKVFGDAEMHHNRGDAAASLRFVCYAGGDGTTILFTWGEIGAGYQLLARKELADLSGEEGFKSPVRDFSCSPTTKVSSSVIVGPGLHLGMPVLELQRRLGKPFKKTGPLLRYSNKTKLSIPGQGDPNELWTVIDRLEVQLEKKFVVAIRAYRVTSQ